MISSMQLFPDLGQTQKLIINGITTLEIIATLFTPIQCQGLTNLMTTDPDVLDDK